MIKSYFEAIFVISTYNHIHISSVALKYDA